MYSPAPYDARFEAHKACVLIPTYNNATTLGDVIRSVLAMTRHLIIVSDGATDATARVLEEFPELQVVAYKPNHGKGYALRKGFRYALSQGYDHAITMDSDGQHFASDLPTFLDKLDEKKDAIVIGARNLQQENMPSQNTFANKFSNFWFWVETGIKAPDTQSGFRLYPIHRIGRMRSFCNKYEFEVEVVVRSVWKGTKVEWAPIKVYYPPKGERISHFRPGADITRITILNTVLVLISFFYIHPRDFIRTMLRAEGRKAFLEKHVISRDESNAKKAASIGFGVFMGIIPIWGFQMIAALALATVMRLNKGLVIIAANISIPPMIPAIITLSFLMGKIWVGRGATDLFFSRGITLESIKLNAVQYLYGSITLAIVAGIASWLISWVLLAMLRRKAAAKAN
ncbi:DUF2062 domain-containing protein [Chitinophaga horti]|uniref:DUF2062 domain-containing protein n=1 Tax=Chitinophaga horti TaxID=2920382 RepID=A0ABY6J2J5_9BACT|nr:DUF2062 domain-containing protein [Chitinophaga horti]UYQ93893.1 DUF2062 domain-containing protein [Chitinophaga horti]